MFADAPSLWPKKLMSSLFARPTQRQARMPGQPCQGRDSTSSSSRCAVFETWVFILVWRPMLVERGGCPAAAARAAAESGKQSWLAEAKVELATGARGKSRELRRFACCRGVGGAVEGCPAARAQGCLLASVLLAASLDSKLHQTSAAGSYRPTCGSKSTNCNLTVRF